MVLLGQDCRIRELSDDPDGGMSDSFACRASTSLGIANVTLVRRGVARDNAVAFVDVAFPSEMRRRALVASFVMADSDRAFVVANLHLESNPVWTELRVQQIERAEDIMTSTMNPPR